MYTKNNILVSVLVTVYNHEKYLEECLSSLVGQKTNFKYEILVHDDCSTDNSKKIIEKFYKKYSEKIVPFFEEENQYSKGVKIIENILIPKMKGKYFCFCEGDDYWIDENKIQKQYDFLEKNQEYKFCVHNSILVDKNSKFIRKKNVSENDGDLTCEDFIIGGGGFVCTNSIFSYSYLAKKLPKYFNYMSLDYIWQIYLSSCGKTYCFKDFMSAYRIQSDGSWSFRMKNNKDKYIEHCKKVITVLEMINIDFNYKYNEIFKKTIIIKNFEILRVKRDFKKMRYEPYKEIWNKLPLYKKIKYLLGEKFPKLSNVLYDIIHK